MNQSQHGSDCLEKVQLMDTGSLFRSSSRRLLFSLAAVLCATASRANAQNVPVPYASTVAGGGVVCAASLTTYAPLAANEKLVGDGCPATQATFNTPVGLGIDRYNNVLVADQTNNLIRVLYNGGAAMAAAIVGANPFDAGLVPKVGNIYTILGGPQSTPTETTFYCTQTGSGIIGYNKQLDGCPGGYAYVQPRGIATDQDGNVFVANFGGNFTVRVIYVAGTAIANLIALENPTLSGSPQPGYVYEIAGTGVPSNTTGGDGGLAYKASVAQPRGLWVDSHDNVYIADNTGGLIRRVDSTTGFISTVAGSCTSASSCPVTASAGDGNPATSSAVKINYPYGLVFDSYGNMFIADSGAGVVAPGRIRVVYAGGTLPGIGNPVVGNIYTYAGGGASSGTQAQQTTFQYVYGVGIDANGYLYVNDYRNATSPGGNHMWRVDPTNGNIVNIAGNGGTAAQTAGGYCSNGAGSISQDTRGDGCPGPQTYMNLPQQAPVFDSFGNFYVAERNTNVVRYFSYTNTFPSTAVGSSVTQALAFEFPFGTSSAPATLLTGGAAGTDFSDAGNDVCVGAASTPQSTVCVVNVKFTPSAGGARAGSIIASPSASSIDTESLYGVGSAPQLTIDPGTQVSLGASIKPQGVSVDLLGNVYLSDGTGKQVLKTTLAGTTPVAVFKALGSPQGTTTDAYGNVYVADATNNNVLQLSAGGSVSTVITGLSAPTGMAADTYGNVYVADTGNNRVLRYSPLSNVSTPVSFFPQTLSAPTQLAVDASGDVYVLDSGNKRILELPLTTPPQAVTLPAGVTPAAFAIDHAGNLYLADTNSATLLVARTTGSQQTLQTGLTAPTGLAIDTAGDLFLADSGASSVLAFQRTASTIAFPATNTGASSLPTALTLSSIGDVSATLGSPLFTTTGNAADFPTGSTGNTCSSSLLLTAGSSCAESFVFSPTATGARSAVATFAPTAGTTVTANLSGTGIHLTTTSLTIAQTAPTTATVSYGQTTTFTATLSSGSTSPAATGTLTFIVDGVTQPAQTIASAGNTLTNNLAVGTHVISANYSGDSVYASSNASFSLTVAASPTTTTVSSSQNVSGVTLKAVVTASYTGALPMSGTITFFVGSTSQGAQPVGNGTVSQLVSVADGTYAITAAYSGDGNYAPSTSTVGTLVVQRTATTTTLTITPVTTSTTVSLQFVVTVSGAGGTPSGTVTLTNGAKTLGVLTLSGGTATLPTAITSNYAFTASYSGNGVFQPSTTSITETADFAVLQQAANLVVPQGEQAVATFGVVSVANYTGTMTAACSNLPPNSLCRFSPIPLAVSPGVNGNLGVQVFVGIDPQVASIGALNSRSWIPSFLALLLAAASLLGLLYRRASITRSLLSLAVLCAFAVGLGGCGQTNAASSQNQTYITPVGTYPMTVSFTDSNKVTHSVTLNVQVNTQ
jgi:sugar lactone lactonase YvrE